MEGGREGELGETVMSAQLSSALQCPLEPLSLLRCVCIKRYAVRSMHNDSDSDDNSDSSHSSVDQSVSESRPCVSVIAMIRGWVPVVKSRATAGHRRLGEWYVLGRSSSWISLSPV